MKIKYFKWGLAVTLAAYILGWIVIIVLVSGCASSIKWQPDPNSPIYTLTGEAADRVAEVIAVNALNQEGRINEVMKYNGWLYASLVALLVGGFIFWGLTRSRFGFVIPSASIGGIVFITFWAEYSRWISLGVLVVSLSLLVFKAVEYQKERNAKGGE